MLGILLLSDISFKSTYPAVYNFPIERAGLSALNTSLVDIIGFNLTATAELWFFFPALLSDSKRVSSVAPLDCSPGETCNSFFIPGSMDTILLDPSQPAISKDSYPKAISYIQNDAPGYQIDFRPIKLENDPPMSLDDCHLYGISFMAIQICLKQVGTSFMAGIFKCVYLYLHKLGMHVLRTLVWKAAV